MWILPSDSKLFSKTDGTADFLPLYFETFFVNGMTPNFVLLELGINWANTWFFSNKSILDKR